MRTRAWLVPGAKRLLHIDIDDLIVLHLTQPNRIWQTHDIVVVLAMPASHASLKTVTVAVNLLLVKWCFLFSTSKNDQMPIGTTPSKFHQVIVNNLWSKEACLIEYLRFPRFYDRCIELMKMEDLTRGMDARKQLRDVNVIRLLFQESLKQSDRLPVCWFQ